MTTGANAPRRGGLLRALRHPAYRMFWMAALVSNTGTWLSNLTVPYVLYQMTGSAVWVGWAAVAQFAPALIFAPLGGTLADTHDRRQLLLWTQVGLAVTGLFMWLAWAFGPQEPLVLVGLLTLFGILNGINNPAWQSLVNDLVPPAEIFSAVTLNSLQFNLARALGPMSAGALLATLGATVAFFLNAVSFVFVIAALLVVRAHPARRAPRAAAGFGRGWRDALGFIHGNPGIRITILLSVMLGLFGNPIFQLTAVFAEDVYEVGPIGLGLLTSALGVGSVLFAVAGALRRVPSVTARSVAGGVVVLAVSLVAMGVAPTLPLGIVAAVAVGAGFLASISGVNTALQLLAGDLMRGRVLAVRHMFYSAAISAGTVGQGIATDMWGVRWATVGAGAILAVAVLMIAVWPRHAGFVALDAVPPDAQAPTAKMEESSAA